MFVYTREIGNYNTFGKNFANIIKVNGNTLNEQVDLIKNTTENIKDRYKRFQITIKHLNEMLKDNEKYINNFISVMDNSNDGLMKTFNTMPDRWSILYKNKIVYKGPELPKGYKKHLKDVEKWIKNHVNNN
eukprot:59522_1